MDDEDIGRREFLKKSIFLLGGLIAAGVAVPSLTYFLSPIWKKDDDDWVELGGVEQIPHGEPVKLDFPRRKKDGWIISEEQASAWVVTADGVNFTVFDPRCTHLGCPYRWDDAKRQFLCPCHNAAFAIDGAVLHGPPPRPLDTYPVKISGGKLLIQTTAKKQEV